MLHVGDTGPCHWALIRGDLDDAEFTAFVEHLRDLARTMQPKQLVLEIAYDFPMPTPVRRRQLVEVVSSARLERVAGHALVTNSTIGRGLLTAINWIVRPPFEEQVFGDVPGALAWLRSRNPSFDSEALMSAVRSVYPEIDRLKW